jgi:hypothetical protein
MEAKGPVEIEMSNEELITLMFALDVLSATKVNPKFDYAIKRNRELNYKKVIEYNKFNSPVSMAKQYMEKKVELINKYTIKNAEGEPEIPEEKEEEFKDLLRKLNEVYQPVLKKVNSTREKLSKYLKNKAKAKIYKIDRQFVPELKENTDKIISVLYR